MFKREIAAALAAGVLLCAPALAAVEYQLEEIGIYGPYEASGGIACSNDGSSWGFWGLKGKKLRLVINGKTVTKEKVGSLRGSVYFTGDGSDWLYSVKGPDDEYFVRTREEKYGPYEIFQPEITRPPTGSSWAVTAFDSSSGMCAVVNGTPYGPYRIDLHFFGGVSPVAFSKDGTGWGSEVSHGDYWAAVINGEELFTYDLPAPDPNSLHLSTVRPSPIAFSGDGEVWGHTGIKSRGADCDYYLRICDREYGPYWRTGIIDISSDGKQWGVNVRLEKGYYALVNGVEIGPFEYCEDVKVANGGESWGAAIIKNGEWYVRINDEEIGPYLRTYRPGFSANGESWAFKAETRDATNGKHEVVNFNGSEIGPFEQVIYAVFSEDGSTLLINHEEDGVLYFDVNGEEFGPFGGSWVEDLSIAKDGSRWFAIIDNRRTVIANGEVLGTFADTATFYSDDYDGFYALEEMKRGRFRVLKYTFNN